MWKLIVLGLLFCFIGCSSSVPRQPPCVGCTMGELVMIPADFTEKQSGVIDISVGGELSHVTIIGPNDSHPTKIVLKKAKSLDDLLHKQIIVCGLFDGDIITATSIKEP